MNLRSSRRICLLAIATVAVGAVAYEPLSAQEAKSNHVQLTIDYGDGVQKHFTALEWKAGLTAFDVLGLAAKHPRGIKFTHQGSGATTLVTSIDDLKNEGRGRNWIFEVGGKLGDRSAALHELKAGDVVLWKFAKYR